MFKNKARVRLHSLAFIFLCFGLTGCAVNQEPQGLELLSSEFSVDPSEIVLTTPVMAAVERDQMLIVQLSELLDTQAVSSQDRAELFYELGVIYDRLGLEGSARTMFMNALVEKPDFAPAYNFLAIYLASAERFSDAFEAFDAALELDPDSAYSYFARAIALYYSLRPEYAKQDIEHFYNLEKNDPYRIIWYYLIECETDGYETALQNLKERYLAADKKQDYFGYHIIDYLTGLITKDKLLSYIRDPEVPMYLRIERACEIYFYLAKEAQRLGQHKLAFDYFHLSERTDKYDFLEYRYALFEIRRMAHKNGLEAYRDRNPLRDPNDF